MSLALVGDRMDIQPHNYAPVTLVEYTFPSIPLPSLPSLLLSEKDMVGWCLRGCMERESQVEAV